MVDRVGQSRQDSNPRSIRQEVEDEFNREVAQGNWQDLEEPASLEAELGLDEVDLDETILNSTTIDDASDPIDDDVDADGVAEDEIDDRELVSDLPQELTQSYGTGLQGQPIDRAGRRAHFSQASQFHQASPDLTGGDIDANYEQANAVGDEAVGGTVITPDQDIVDDLGKAVGVEVDDRSFLRTNDLMEQRDDRRWELDPQSSEDYSQRRQS